MAKRDPVDVLCVECGRPIIIYLAHNNRWVKPPDRDHDLCRKCWRASRDRDRSRLLKAEHELV